MQYREGTTGNWTDGGHTGAALTATLTGLSENTSHQVQVRATNDEGTGDWSDSGTGTTDANAAPTFSSSATFDAAENQTAAGTVLATDGDTDDDVTGYAITGGADEAFFSIGATSGALTFQSAPNFEDAKDADTDNEYEVTVQATSGTDTRVKTATQAITVTVTDVSGEKPATPAAPTVAAASVTSLTVNWSAPANAGPAITDYDVQYRAGTTGNWSDGGHSGTATTATLTGLSENTSYQVQVRATNDEGTGDWSDAGSGATDANAAPAFSSSATFDAAENQTAAGTVLATDGDTGDDITGYAITGGRMRRSSRSGRRRGALTFQSAPNFEDAKDADTDNEYEVTVQATSGTDTRVKTATQAITVTVTDVSGEKPAAPAAPTVAAASVTSLTVTWTKPANAGPEITDYDVQYREGASGTWSDGGHVGTAVTATLSGLSENTSYQVQVRATNAEGTGSWSDSGTGATDANAAPAFSSSATFDAAENQTSAGTVVATDSDSDDDITAYAITGGADQAFFSIVPATGALTFKTAPNFEDAKDQGTNNTYVVEVTATSGTGTRVKTATQTITVTVTDVSGEAPGKPAAPTVAAASVTSLTVTWSAPANAGPAITDYDVQYRAGTATSGPHGDAGVCRRTRRHDHGSADRECGVHENRRWRRQRFGLTSRARRTRPTRCRCGPPTHARAPAVTVVGRWRRLGTSLTVTAPSPTDANAAPSALPSRQPSRAFRRTRHQVQVRATNDAPARGRTRALAAPTWRPCSFTGDDAAENQTAAGTVVATDSDSDDDITGYAITGGADQAFFSIVPATGALTFKTAPNFEDAKDQGTNNTYVVTVTGDQRHGGAGQDGDADDHGDGDRREHGGAGQAGSADGGAGVGDEPDGERGRRRPTRVRPSPTTTCSTGQGTSGAWSDGTHNGTAITATLTGLSENTSYPGAGAGHERRGHGRLVGLGLWRDGHQPAQRDQGLLDRFRH